MPQCELALTKRIQVLLPLVAESVSNREQSLAPGNIQVLEKNQLWKVEYKEHLLFCESQGQLSQEETTAFSNDFH